MRMDLAFISIVILTFNSARTLLECLESIREKDYTQGDVEIIIADASSSDGTVKFARRFTEKIYSNPLKTGEAGKAVGVRHARREVVALIDSDNICLSRIGLEGWCRRLRMGRLRGRSRLVL